MQGFSKHLLLTLAVLGATLVTAKMSDQRQPEPLAAPLESVPDTVSGWEMVGDSRLQEETENVLAASSYLSRRYAKDNQWMDFFVAYYAMQQAGEAMHSPKNCLPGGGWEIWNYEDAQVTTSDGREVTINKYYIQKNQSRLIVFYWYQNRERVVASEYYAKVCLIWDALVKQRTSGSIVRLMLPDVEWADEAGLEFASEIIPLLDQAMPEG